MGSRMKRIQLIVAYDGTNYCGWQIQPNGTTIEEVLKRHVSELVQEEIQIIGASRTDSGVHALGNVAVFDTETKIPADKLCFALNQRLPEDIRIQASFEVERSFHPRRCNSTKTYEYRILNRVFALPCERLYSHFVYMPLDLEAMRAAAAYLIGEHDFASFCSARSQAEDTYRTIYSLDVEKAGDMITIRISGNGFLYNMVRIIVGTLMKVGLHVYPAAHMQEILSAKNRYEAGPKAPAAGLTLAGIEYERELPESRQIENEEGRYLVWQKSIPVTGEAYLEIAEYEQGLLLQLLERTARQAMRDGAGKLYVSAPEELMQGAVCPMEEQAAPLTGQAELSPLRSVQAGEYVFEKCEKATERGRYTWVSSLDMRKSSNRLGGHKSA